MKNYLIILAISFCQVLSGQQVSKDAILDLAKVYKENHAGGHLEEAFVVLESISSPELQTTKSFIAELIQENNDIVSDKYLSKPDSVTLHSLYIIRGLTWNMYRYNSDDTTYGLDSLLSDEVSYNELLSSYYDMLFTSVLNKNRPFDMSNINFEMDSYNLENNEEKGIFFLESMEVFGKMILGYFYIDPPNYEKAIDYISKYPKYNGQAYYKYQDLDFEDFDFVYSRTESGSYKKYRLNSYMITILRHAECLAQDETLWEEVNKVLYDSILSDNKYWQYSEVEELLKQIFR